MYEEECPHKFTASQMGFNPTLVSGRNSKNDEKMRCVPVNTPRETLGLPDNILW
jgi:hypothetical protein